MDLNFARKLGFYIWKTSIMTQKINSSALETFGIVITDFQVEDKVNRFRFFQETFLVVDIKFEIILGMLFLKLSNLNVLFYKKTLTQRTYTTNKAIPITKQVEIINKRDFIIAMLDTNSKAFVIHVAI